MITFLRSVSFAFGGIVDAVMWERNFRIEWLAGLMVFLIASLFDFGFLENTLLVLLVFLVLSLELLNSAIEKICDSMGTAFCENKKRAKNYGAASVMLMASAAAFIFFGLIKDQAGIFLIHFMDHQEAYFFLAAIFLLNMPICLARPTIMPILAALFGIFLGIFFLIQFSEWVFFFTLASIFHGVMIISYVKLALFLPQPKKHVDIAHE